LPRASSDANVTRVATGPASPVRRKIEVVRHRDNAVDRVRVIVTAAWDPAAEVFVATSDDVPGLVAEAPTPSALDAKLRR
jgi:hypothetical protein